MRRLRTVVVGSGSHIPGRRVLNDSFLSSHFYQDYGKPYPQSDMPKIVAKFQQITDIAERRYVEGDLLASDIGFDAAEKAIQDAGIDPETLDYIIVAHNFGDVKPENLRTDVVPPLAARIKAKLGIANPHCVAYDLPFGCPGWVQAVIQASYYLRSGDAKRALVIGAETLSRVSDPFDRDSMIYADGAGAVVLEAQEHAEPVGILAHSTRSDTLNHVGLLWLGTSFNTENGDGQLYTKMNGRKLYEYAVSHVPGVVKESLDKAGLTLMDVDKVLIHQANGKMDEAILKRICRLYDLQEIPEGIMPMTISWLGNSSVATVPTLLDLIRKGEMEGHTFKSGDVVIFASVGAGMAINSIVYRMP